MSRVSPTRARLPRGRRPSARRTGSRAYWRTWRITEECAARETEGGGLQGQASGRGVMPSLQGIIQTSGVASHLLPTGHQPAAPAQPELARGVETGQGDNMLKIQYKEYDQKILCAELRPHGPGGAVRHSAGVQVYMQCAAQ